jgi:protein SCO1/2
MNERRAVKNRMTHSTRSVALTLGLVVGLLASACRAKDQPAEAYRGVTLVPAQAKPDFKLTTTSNQPYDFVTATHGVLTLLYFGYTHCPDVCPVHMANIAAVLQKMSSEQRSHVRVVFVTTDPERDTAAQLRQWLDTFDPTFIGLRGDTAEVNRVAAVLNLPAASRDGEGAGDSASYGVSHFGAVLAFTPDDSLRLLYPFGVRQQDLAHDLPLLLKVGH